jgi:hypothetical protein
MKPLLLRCMSPFMALNGRNRNLDECQLLGKERTSKLHNV